MAGLHVIKNLKWSAYWSRKFNDFFFPSTCKALIVNCETLAFSDCPETNGVNFMIVWSQISIKVSWYSISDYWYMLQWLRLLTNNCNRHFSYKDLNDLTDTHSNWVSYYAITQNARPSTCNMIVLLVHLITVTFCPYRDTSAQPPQTFWSKHTPPLSSCSHSRKQYMYLHLFTWILKYHANFIRLKCNNFK